MAGFWIYIFKVEPKGFGSALAMGLKEQSKR